MLSDSSCSCNAHKNCKDTIPDSAAFDCVYPPIKLGDMSGRLSAELVGISSISNANFWPFHIHFPQYIPPAVINLRMIRKYREANSYVTSASSQRIKDMSSWRRKQSNLGSSRLNQKFGTLYTLPKTCDCCLHPSHEFFQLVLEEVV